MNHPSPFSLLEKVFLREIYSPAACRLTIETAYKLGENIDAKTQMDSAWSKMFCLCTIKI